MPIVPVQRERVSDPSSRAVKMSRLAGKATAAGPLAVRMSRLAGNPVVMSYPAAPP